MRLGQKGAILLALACLLTVLVLPGVSASTSPRSFSFGAAGDFGNTSAARSTFSAAGSAGLDFFLVLGDSTYGQTSETAWCNAFKAKVPQVLIQAGNHETGESSGANLTKLVSACPYGLNETLTGQYGR